MVEAWLPVVGFTDYEVSSIGRVRRISDCLNQVAVQWRAGHILKPFPSSGMKYPYVSLAHPNGRKKKAVHVLVCEAFHGPKPTPQHEVAHWDRDITNISKENLRWATPHENHEDMKRHGTMNVPVLKGEAHGRAKLTEAIVRQIRMEPKERGLFTRLARRYGVDRSTISSAYKGDGWACV